jgi:hypothetical protein
MLRFGMTVATRRADLEHFLCARRNEKSQPQRAPPLTAWLQIQACITIQGQMIDARRRPVEGGRADSRRGLGGRL